MQRALCWLWSCCSQSHTLCCALRGLWSCCSQPHALCCALRGLWSCCSQPHTLCCALRRLWSCCSQPHTLCCALCRFCVYTSSGFAGARTAAWSWRPSWSSRYRGWTWTATFSTTCTRRGAVEPAATCTTWPLLLCTTGPGESAVPGSCNSCFTSAAGNKKKKKNLKREWLLAFWNKTQTLERFKQMLFVTTPCGMWCFVPINKCCCFLTFCVHSVYDLLLLHIMRLQECAGSICNSSLTSVVKGISRSLFVGHHEPCWGLDSSICNSSTFVVKGSAADDLLLSIMSLVGEHSSSICNSFTSVVKGSAADDLLLGSVVVVFVTPPLHLLWRGQQQICCCPSWALLGSIAGVFVTHLHLLWRD